MKNFIPPGDLGGLKAWLLWKSEQFSGEQKPRKIPYYVDGGKRHGQQGTDEERSRLVSYAAALDALQNGGYSGLAFAPLPGFDVVALDFDNCVGPDGIAPEVLSVVAGTYAETSPSGKGIRALFRGDVGNHKKISRDGEVGFETFSTTGFVTITGNVLPGVELAGFENEVAAVTPAVLAYCQKRFGHDTRQEIQNANDPLATLKPKLGLTPNEMTELVELLDPDIDRDSWIRVGMGLHHECDGDDTGFEIWNDWSSKGAKYPSEDNLREQWRSFDRMRNKGRQVTLATTKYMVNQLNKEESATATPEELAAVLANTLTGPRARVGTPADFNGKFPAQSAAALSRQPPLQWLIKGVVPKGEVGVMFGASGTGKSFAALEMGGAIARGVPWRGHKATKGRVLIIAAEGGRGVGKRLKAYAQHHEIDIDTLHIAVITAAPNFLLKEDIFEIVKTVKASGGFDLIITDTFAQVTPGANENAGEDMGLAMSNAKALGLASAGLVLLVHHSGKIADKGARGWSGIKAAADVEFEVKKHDGDTRSITITKMKDGEEGHSFAFRLKSINLGSDNDGDPITSCAVVPVDLVMGLKPERSGLRGAVQKQLQSIARDLGAYTAAGADEQTVIERTARAMKLRAGLRDQRRTNAKKTLKGLLDVGIFVSIEGRLYSCDVAPRPSEKPLH
jgi:hypothetical protein